MTTSAYRPATVRVVDGGLFERLRRVDHRIWDGLITLVVFLASLAAFVTAQAPR